MKTVRLQSRWIPLYMHFVIIQCQQAQSAARSSIVFSATDSETVLLLHTTSQGDLLVLTSERLYSQINENASLPLSTDVGFFFKQSQSGIKVSNTHLSDCSMGNRRLYVVLCENSVGCVLFMRHRDDVKINLINSNLKELLTTGTLAHFQNFLPLLVCGERGETIDVFVNVIRARTPTGSRSSAATIRIVCKFLLEKSNSAACEKVAETLTDAPLRPPFPYTRTTQHFLSFVYGNFTIFLTSQMTPSTLSSLEHSASYIRPAVWRICVNDESRHLSSLAETQLVTTIENPDCFTLSALLTQHLILADVLYAATRYYRRETGEEFIYLAGISKGVVYLETKPDWSVAYDTRDLDFGHSTWYIARYSLKEIMASLDNESFKCERAEGDVSVTYLSDDFNNLTARCFPFGQPAPDECNKANLAGTCADEAVASSLITSRKCQDHGRRTRPYRLSPTILSASSLMEILPRTVESIYEIIDMVVVDDSTVFLAFSIKDELRPSEWMLVKAALGREGNPRSLSKSVLWKRRNLFRPYDLEIPAMGRYIALSGESILAINDSSVVVFPLNSCDLYETCEEVVEANANGDTLDCVWCYDPWGNDFAVARGNCSQLALSSNGGCLLKRGPEISPANTHLLVAVLVPIFGLVALSAGAVLFAAALRSRRAKVQQMEEANAHVSSLRQMLHQPEESALLLLPRVERKYVSVREKLGGGAYGEVFSGFYANKLSEGSNELPVAIKMLPAGVSTRYRVLILEEAILMNKFDHPNIVRLIGVCLKHGPPWLLLELMGGGDLLSRLRAARPNKDGSSPELTLSLRDLHRMAVDVALACEYLEQQHHVHRDIAARNCLVSSPRGTVKLADFGLARDTYENEYYRIHGHNALPVRWLAPESIVEKMFTSKSDVWSYGVLLWELLSLGEVPYHGRSNEYVMDFVTGGGYLDPPEQCPYEIYKVMSTCWQLTAVDRPMFSELLSRLHQLEDDTDLISTIPWLPENQMQNPDLLPCVLPPGYEPSRDFEDSSLSSIDIYHVIFTAEAFAAEATMSNVA